MLEMIPVKSETLKVEDRKKLRDMISGLNQLFGEQSGILRTLREEYAGKKEILAEVHATPAPRPTYADKIKGRESFVVRIDPKNKDQTVETTKEQLKEKVDVCGKQIGVINIKKGKNGSVFVECTTKRDAEKLKVTVAEKMPASAKEIGKTNPVMCIYGIDSSLEEKLLQCMRQQNYALETHYADVPALKKDIKIFRYFSSKRDNERGVKNVVFSASGRLRDLLVNRNVYVMWRTCGVRDYRNILYCYKCLGTGHKAKDCKNEAVCGNCGGSHEKTDCKSSTIKCAVCEKRNIPGVNLKHVAYGRDCMSLKKLLEIAEKRTNYNG